MAVKVTKIDDSVRGRKGPCVHFWARTTDLNLQKSLDWVINAVAKGPPPPRKLSKFGWRCFGLHQ